MNFLNPLFERTVSTCEKDNQISALFAMVTFLLGFKNATSELLWLMCLLSIATYPKLGCDHYYSDVAFLKPNKNVTIANSADI
jgi:hypothetical protein